jgi:class 3 adenylate cyclase
VQNLIAESPDADGLFEKRERDLTVMFADMTGYTRLSAQLPLDQANAVVERYFGAFLDEILRHGGDVNETAGDGLMVLFQHEDPEAHARAAVRAALGIQRITREINAARSGEIQIGMHIGINSGIASVGATKIQGGAGLRWTYTASGPTTNIAARVGALGEEVALTDETRARLGDAFVLESVGEKTLKNVSHPVLVWRAIAEAKAVPEEAKPPPPPVREPEPEEEKAPRAGRLRIHGTVLAAATRRALPGLLVRAYDWDLLRDDVLGESTTDADGNFEVLFLTEFAGLLERKPDVFLRVFDAPGGRELHSTRDRIRWNVELDEHFALEIPDPAADAR